MDTIAAIREMVAKSGKPKTTISAELGRSANWLVTTLGKGNGTRANTLAEIADACGYDLLLEKRDTKERIIIDSPQR